MPSDSNSSAPSSAPTSNAAPKNQPSTKPGSQLSEADYLARQAADAKAAISRVTQEITSDLANTIDPRGWVQTAPWTTLAAAVLVGFAGTAMVVPSKEEQALRRLRKLEKALRLREAKSHRRNGKHAVDGDGEHDVDGVDDGDHSERKSSSHSFLGTLAGHAFHLLKPMVMSGITAAISSRAAAPPPPPQSTPGPAADLY